MVTVSVIGAFQAENETYISIASSLEHTGTRTTVRWIGYGGCYGNGSVGLLMRSGVLRAARTEVSKGQVLAPDFERSPRFAGGRHFRPEASAASAPGAMRKITGLKTWDSEK